MLKTSKKSEKKIPAFCFMVFFVAPRVSGSRGRSSVPRHAAQAPEPYVSVN